MKNFYNKGVAVMELMVVLAIIILLVAIVMPQLRKTKENQVLKNAVEDVISALNKASSQTLASINSSEYGVHFEADKVIIFKGTTFVPDIIDNETINIIAPASISEISLTMPNEDEATEAGTDSVESSSSGETVDVYFNRLTNTPSITGTITITSGSNSKTITIGATGIISVN